MPLSPPQLSDSSPSAWRFVLRIWLVSRAFVALFVYAGHASHPFREPIAGGFAGVSNWWLNPWTTFDSAHFLLIASAGYQPGTRVFFPLLPGLLQPLAPDENAMALWGIVLSNALLLVALWLLLRLVERESSTSIARRAVFVTAFFPTSAFFSAVYTESLFFVCALAMFWAARSRRWVWAGAWGLAAACARNSGPLLTLALALLVWRRRGEMTRREVLAASLASLVPALAFVAIQIGHRVVGGGALSSVSSQAAYFRAPSWPWLPLWRDASDILSGRALDAVTLLNFGCVPLAIALCVRFRRKIEPGYLSLIAALLLVQLCLSRQIPPYTIATARYLMTLFPFAWMIAWQAEEVEASPLARRLATALYLGLCALQSFQFGQKAFIA